MQSAHDKSSLSNIAFNLFALKESFPSGVLSSACGYLRVHNVKCLRASLRLFRICRRGHATRKKKNKFPRVRCTAGSCSARILICI